MTFLLEENPVLAEVAVQDLAVPNQFRSTTCSILAKNLVTCSNWFKAGMIFLLEYIGLTILLS
jgi:hypothetical protein